MESSLTRGSERPRSPSETVTTTRLRNGSLGPAEGADAAGDAVGTAGVGTRVDEGVGGDEPHAQRRTAAIKRTNSGRWRRWFIRHSVADAQPGLDDHRAQEAFLARRLRFGGSPWSALPRG